MTGTRYVQAVMVGQQPLLAHAASETEFRNAIRNAQHSADITAAFKPDSLCGVQVLVDHISYPKTWHPGVENACMACVAALP
ncbi:hypothetical protein [Herbidospora daliensis]|uniref:hypothetical protein n=1 Tax=Herbidospora daliensis TaxID=295585 RepID=UPI0007852E69|nr:hypothetical protein [Herbidospora daliensis]